MKLTFKNASILLFILSLTVIQVKGQTGKALQGAWENTANDTKVILLFQDGYFTQSIYQADRYIKSLGGPYIVKEGKVTIKLEFDSEKNEMVGSNLTADFTVQGSNLDFTVNSDEEKKALEFKRIDNGDAPLAGVWHITDRMQGGNLVPIQRSGTRKTLKILTGDRFQWFAIDPGTKQFMGTGGGIYTFENDKYTENIEFFSRDDSRVGAALSFDGQIKEGNWHHSGLSSKGDRIYEVWGRINKD